jgi:dipeptidyl aminopeptidase/acylaminoacyl peptidase
VGHTDRFAAASSNCPVTNWMSFVGTTDGPSWYRNFERPFWEDPSEYLKRSPIMYVGNVKTPTMLVHGENDNDVHITQAEEMYTALKMRGVDTVLVRYPREGHGIREPKHRVDNLQRVLDWFEKYLK